MYIMSSFYSSYYKSVEGQILAGCLHWPPFRGPFFCLAERFMRFNVWKKVFRLDNLDTCIMNYFLPFLYITFLFLWSSTFTEPLIKTLNHIFTSHQHSRLSFEYNDCPDLVSLVFSINSFTVRNQTFDFTFSFYGSWLPGHEATFPQSL